MRNGTRKGKGRKERRDRTRNFRIIWNRLEERTGWRERKKKKEKVERNRSHATNLGAVNKHSKEEKRENKTRDGK